MQVRIEKCEIDNQDMWFVDAWWKGGWKNVSSHKTEAEAVAMAKQVEESK